MHLKVDISTEDAYPKPDAFEESIKNLFASRVNEARESGCE